MSTPTGSAGAPWLELSLVHLARPPEHHGRPDRLTGSQCPEGLARPVSMLLFARQNVIRRADGPVRNVMRQDP